MDQYWRDQGAARIPHPWGPALDPNQMAEARNLQWHYFRLLRNEQREAAARVAAEAAARYPQRRPYPPPPPMYLDHNDVAAMEPKTLNFNPWNPSRSNTQINGRRRTPEGLEAFQERIRRERFAALRGDLTVMLVIDAGSYLGYGTFCVFCVVCVVGVAWVGGLAMKLVFSGMGWKDNSDGVWSRKRG